jgi:hypothetical protein
VRLIRSFSAGGNALTGLILFLTELFIGQLHARQNFGKSSCGAVVLEKEDYMRRAT